MIYDDKYRSMERGMEMKLALIGISILCVVLIAYLAGMKLQLRSIRKQLESRRKEQREGLITLELQDRQLKEMTVALNQTLMQEEELRRQQNIQEREFRNLITNISHDLRTPLTVMKGYLQLLERCEIDGTGREYLGICFRHMDELEQRIRQFFEYSYWINQEEDVQLHPVNVTNLIMDAMTDFVPVFEEKGITMKLEADTRRKAMADEELLKRIIQNILKNCLQYSTGEVKVSVVEAESGKHGGDRKIKVTVSNPVAEDSKLNPAQVFQRFYVGNEARNHSTGLGLSIVKLLIEKMQGAVFAKQEEGVFSVGFMLKQEKTGI